MKHATLVLVCLVSAIASSALQAKNEASPPADDGFIHFGDSSGGIERKDNPLDRITDLFSAFQVQLNTLNQGLIAEHDEFDVWRTEGKPGETAAKVTQLEEKLNATESEISTLEAAVQSAHGVSPPATAAASFLRRGKSGLEHGENPLDRISELFSAFQTQLNTLNEGVIAEHDEFAVWRTDGTTGQTAEKVRQLEAKLNSAQSEVSEMSAALQLAHDTSPPATASFLRGGNATLGHKDNPLDRISDLFSALQAQLNTLSEGVVEEHDEFAAWRLAGNEDESDQHVADLEGKLNTAHDEMANATAVVQAAGELSPPQVNSSFLRRKSMASLQKHNPLDRISELFTAFTLQLNTMNQDVIGEHDEFQAWRVAGGLGINSDKVTQLEGKLGTASTEVGTLNATLEAADALSPPAVASFLRRGRHDKSFGK